MYTVRVYGVRDLRRSGDQQTAGVLLAKRRNPSCKFQPIGVPIMAKYDAHAARKHGHRVGQLSDPAVICKEKQTGEFSWRTRRFMKEASRSYQLIAL